MKIGVIGIGGKTATMFAKELVPIGEVFGIGKKEEIEKIRKKKLFVKRNKNEELVEIPLIEENEFPKDIQFDFLFLCIKNPVFEAVKFYYQKVKEKKFPLPALFLSQNGIEAGEDAILALNEVFGERAKEISIFRISLFNPVEKKKVKEKEFVIYSLPVRLAISQISGKEIKIREIFEKTKIETYSVSQKDSKNMEYSKLFLNLIGMACAVEGFSIFEGFKKREIFKKEVLALREYIKAVKENKGKFLNFPHYPVKFLSFLFQLPIPFLFLISPILAFLIEKGRKGKPKDLDEIDYYNGAVIKLAKKAELKVPINEEILKKAKEKYVH
jgi:hypothetical protein